ncbi:hypothetical protein LOK49_LG12G02120 [Camellia lanceoleosa]|uniref:Uncharacterized protein n=1 Tax=Camellia lanceoleosa TaxID=1840588 RepID=A0ACC0FVB5_9ERIC|nr:hypothetical protein LOK49_LG12G02120 [Camellia lanceoleosa]
MTKLIFVFIKDLDQSSHDVSKSKVELDEHSQASSEVTELDPCENEVQSPMAAIHLRGTSKSKAKKSSMKLRCTYRAYNDVDEITAAYCIGFNPAGTKRFKWKDLNSHYWKVLWERMVHHGT